MPNGLKEYKVDNYIYSPYKMTKFVKDYYLIKLLKDMRRRYPNSKGISQQFDNMKDTMIFLNHHGESPDWKKILNSEEFKNGYWTKWTLLYNEDKDEIVISSKKGAFNNSSIAKVDPADAVVEEIAKSVKEPVKPVKEKMVKKEKESDTIANSAATKGKIRISVIKTTVDVKGLSNKAAKTFNIVSDDVDAKFAEILMGIENGIKYVSKKPSLMKKAERLSYIETYKAMVKAGADYERLKKDVDNYNPKLMSDNERKLADNIRDAKQLLAEAENAIISAAV